MWLNYMMVALGGSLGAIARYQVSLLGQSYWDGHFPWSTFLVNIAGSFLFGIFFVLITEKALFSENIRLLVLVGFLGAFTTFSTFSFELLDLFKTGEYLTGILYTLGSVVLSLIALAVAYFATRSALALV